MIHWGLVLFLCILFSILGFLFCALLAAVKVEDERSYTSTHPVTILIHRSRRDRRRIWKESWRHHCK